MKHRSNKLSKQNKTPTHKHKHRRALRCKGKLKLNNPAGVTVMDAVNATAARHKGYNLRKPQSNAKQSTIVDGQSTGQCGKQQQLQEPDTKKAYKTRSARRLCKPPISESSLQKSPTKPDPPDSATPTPQHRSLEQFALLCDRIASAEQVSEKIEIIKLALANCDDVKLWCRMLLPQLDTRVCNIKTRQLVKMYARVFNNIVNDNNNYGFDWIRFNSACNCKGNDARLNRLEMLRVELLQTLMLKDLERTGDVAQTIISFFNEHKLACNKMYNCNFNLQENAPNNETEAFYRPLEDRQSITLAQVDEFLNSMAGSSAAGKHSLLYEITRRCNSTELKYLIRIMKRDLKINAGSKCVLEALSPTAYLMFQLSKDLNLVLDLQCAKESEHLTLLEDPFYRVGAADELGNKTVCSNTNRLLINASGQSPVYKNDAYFENPYAPFRVQKASIKPPDKSYSESGNQFDFPEYSNCCSNNSEQINFVDALMEPFNFNPTAKPLEGFTTSNTAVLENSLTQLVNFEPTNFAESFNFNLSIDDFLADCPPQQEVNFFPDCNYPNYTPPNYTPPNYTPPNYTPPNYTPPNYTIPIYPMQPSFVNLPPPPPPTLIQPHFPPPLMSNFGEPMPNLEPEPPNLNLQHSQAMYHPPPEQFYPSPYSAPTPVDYHQSSLMNHITVDTFDNRPVLSLKPIDSLRPETDTNLVYTNLNNCSGGTYTVIADPPTKPPKRQPTKSKKSVPDLTLTIDGVNTQIDFEESLYRSVIVQTQKLNTASKTPADQNLSFSEYLKMLATMHDSEEKRNIRYYYKPKNSNKVSRIRVNLSSKVNLSMDSDETLSTVAPMLAAQCKSIDVAFKKFPDGMLCEYKYDGERVQIHKNCDDFKYYSRSLKLVPDKKLGDLTELLQRALPPNSKCILDCEMLMIDTDTGKFLPFDAIGVHKRKAFKSAKVCIVVFDCMYFNGRYLYREPLSARRTIIKDNLTLVENRIMLSEQKLVRSPSELIEEFKQCLRLNMEGLMLKCANSCYMPGKRRWLKLKRDYFKNSGDTADLIILGAWYGTGRLGGLLSVFLMGCVDKSESRDPVWVGLTKVHAGLNDVQIKQLNDALEPLMVHSAAVNLDSLGWHFINAKDARKMPTMIAIDPKRQPVLEVLCTEVTANLSFRFPRVLRIRTDKDWTGVTSLGYIKELASSEGSVKL